MTTLRIEHDISAFDQWRAAFDRFADARASAGVRAHRILQPIDDVGHVLVDLDFDDLEPAKAFLGSLEKNARAAPENSPALIGTPQTSLLELRDAT